MPSHSLGLDKWEKSYRSAGSLGSHSSLGNFFLLSFHRSPSLGSPALTHPESAFLWTWKRLPDLGLRDTWVPTQENTPLPPVASAPLTQSNSSQAAGWAVTACGRGPSRTESLGLPGSRQARPLLSRAASVLLREAPQPLTIPPSRWCLFRRRHWLGRARGLRSQIRSELAPPSHPQSPAAFRKPLARTRNLRGPKSVPSLPPPTETAQ